MQSVLQLQATCIKSKKKAFKIRSSVIIIDNKQPLLNLIITHWLCMAIRRQACICPFPYQYRQCVCLIFKSTLCKFGHLFDRYSNLKYVCGQCELVTHIEITEYIASKIFFDFQLQVSSFLYMQLYLYSLLADFFVMP